MNNEEITKELLKIKSELDSKLDLLRVLIKEKSKPPKPRFKEGHLVYDKNGVLTRIKNVRPAWAEKEPEYYVYSLARETGGYAYEKDLFTKAEILAKFGDEK